MEATDRPSLDVGSAYLIVISSCVQSAQRTLKKGTVRVVLSSIVSYELSARRSMRTLRSSPREEGRKQEKGTAREDSIGPQQPRSLCLKP